VTKHSKKRTLCVLTNSETETFRTCPQKWSFAYREGLRPKVAARPLAFGSAIHSGLEAAYREIAAARQAGTHQGLSPEGLSAISRAACEAKLRAWDDTVAAASAEPNEDAVEESEQTADLAKVMLARYWDRFQHDAVDLIPLAIEWPFEVVLRSSIGRAVSHLRWAGVIDLVAFDPVAGDVVIFDHKTTSGPVSSIDRRVEMDPQIAGYLWALREVLIRDKERALPLFGLLTPEQRSRAISGRAPLGRVIYNVLRKSAPRQPVVTLKGLVSSAAIDTTSEIYEAALLAQEARGLPRTEAQADRLHGLRERGDVFVSRRAFWRSDSEIDRWRREALLDASRIRQAKDDPSLLTRSPGACTAPWSPPCAYRSICLQPESQELRSLFRVATTAHEEIREAEEVAQPDPF